jgi:hypothetical protein
MPPEALPIHVASGKAERDVCRNHNDDDGDYDRFHTTPPGLSARESFRQTIGESATTGNVPVAGV